MDKLISNGRSLLMLATNVLAVLVSVSAQPGFLSVNCGGGDNYTDSVSNISWVADGHFIDVGEVANVSNSNIPYHLQSLRYFPKPLNKSCYSLPLNINVTYLIRLWFLFGNYNGIQELPSFNFSLETQGMLYQKMISISPRLETPEFTRERIITSSTNALLYVCFIRTSDSSDPFISAIEFRSLSGGVYEAQLERGIMLNSGSRYDLGAQYSGLIRYPQDRFDRLWNSDSNMSVVDEVNYFGRARSNRMVMNNNNNNITSFPPAVVMQTALVAEIAVSRLRWIFEQQNRRTLFVLYFAEVDHLNGSEARNFNVMVNDEIVHYIDSSLQNHSIELPFTYNDTQRKVVISLETVEEAGMSNRGPLLNALEYYQIVESEPHTDGSDVAALLSIKMAFGVKGWISDPCFGVEWTGIRCSKGLPDVRILDLGLSERNLSGTVPERISQLTELRSIYLQNNNLSGTLPDLCSLTKLETIRLENNHLTGIIPDCLSHLSNLKQLYLSNNNFSGDVPQGLLKKPSLILSYIGNPHLCKGKDKCQSKSNKVGIVVKSAIGVVVLAFVVIILLTIFHRRHNSKKRNKIENMNANQEGAALIVPNPVKSRSFSVVEMMGATQNLSHKIGQGGFGSVYLGKLQDGKDVAVKLLSSTSKQGASEFLNEECIFETTCLSTDRSAVSIESQELGVSLLGYCSDFKQLMLVYEHVPCGSLNDHLYGSLSNSSTLDWKTRLRIALDAAEGLEYLHESCTPKIVHRDVKSSNILLDSRLQAKVADFGLSKMIGDDNASHVTTTIKGSIGYLDPEYFRTSHLTEKSDVYSFGVVLLEIVCGRKPVDPDRPEEEISLIKWVMMYMEMNDESGRQLRDILDKRLRLSENDFESFYNLLALSIKCIEIEASKRPTIGEVVAQIRDALISVKSDETTEGDVWSFSFGEHSSSLTRGGR